MFLDVEARAARPPLLLAQGAASLHLPTRRVAAWPFPRRLQDGPHRAAEKATATLRVHRHRSEVEEAAVFSDPPPQTDDSAVRPPDGPGAGWGAGGASTVGKVLTGAVWHAGGSPPPGGRGFDGVHLVLGDQNRQPAFSHHD